MVALLALLYSGLAQALIAPPLSWVLLHVTSWVPALWFFSKLSGRRAFFAGWLVGTSANLAIFYWLMITAHNFLGIPVLITPFVLLAFAAVAGFYVAVFAYGFRRIYRSAGAAWPFAIAAWFCALEFLMPQIFSYFQGVAWYQQPRIFLISSLTGVSGVTFLVITCNTVMLQAIKTRCAGWKGRKALFINVTILALLLMFTFIFSSHRLGEIEQAEANAKNIVIAVIQPDYSVQRKAELGRQPPGSFAQDLMALSRKVALTSDEHIDVFVWPENALTKPPTDPSNRQVLEFAKQINAEVWTGALYKVTSQTGQRVDTDAYRNAAYRINANGEVDAPYSKTLLIPFGEYVPLKGILPALDQVRLPGNFEPGNGIKIFSSENARFSFLICYEAIKSAYVRTAILNGAEILVNVSGDTRSGNHTEQRQHLMLAAMQSAQYGVPLVRSTSTGISAVVDTRGLITAQTAVFERGGLIQRVRPLQVPSFYGQFGNWFAWICVSISILLLVAGKRLKFYVKQPLLIRVNLSSTDSGSD